MVRGLPHRFLCEFSEELDDYPAEYRVWPIQPDALTRELAAWEIFVAWRTEFDSGREVPPLEENREFRALHDSLQQERVAPANAVVVVPTWRLDSVRSFKERTPRHWAAWSAVHAE